MHSDQQRVATADYALRLIAKNLDQMDSHLNEIEDQIPALLRSDATQLIYGLAVQSDRISKLHVKLARLVDQLVNIREESGKKAAREAPPEEPSVDDPMEEKDPWETDFPQITSYLWRLDMD